MFFIPAVLVTEILSFLHVLEALELLKDEDLIPKQVTRKELLHRANFSVEVNNDYTPLWQTLQCRRQAGNLQFNWRKLLVFRW